MDMDWTSAEPLRLKEVLPFVSRAQGTAWNLLQRNRFPIKHIAARPYLFARRDVQAFAERGEITNPSLLARKKRRCFAPRRAS